MPDPLPGWKTYLAAAGLFCLAVYQVSQGVAHNDPSQYTLAIQSVMAAFAAFGLRQAIARK